MTLWPRAYKSSHPYFLQTYDVSDCCRSKYGESRPLSAKANRKHSKIRYCAHTYTLGDIWQTDRHANYVLNTLVNLGRFLLSTVYSVHCTDYSERHKLEDFFWLFIDHAQTTFQFLKNFISFRWGFTPCLVTRQDVARFVFILLLDDLLIWLTKGAPNSKDSPSEIYPTIVYSQYSFLWRHWLFCLLEKSTLKKFYGL